MMRELSEYICGLLLLAGMAVPVIIVLVWLGGPA